MSVNGLMLRNLIQNGSIEITNLKITSDNRVINVDDYVGVSHTKITKSPEREKEEYFNKFLSILEYINKVIKIINETSGYYARGTEYGLRNRVYGVNIYEPGRAIMQIPSEVIYESVKYGGMVKLSINNQHLCISVHGPHSNGYFNCSMAAIIKYCGLTINEEKYLRKMFEDTLKGGEDNKRHKFSDRDIIINTFKEFLNSKDIVKIRLKGVMSKYAGRYSTLLSYM